MKISKNTALFERLWLGSIALGVLASALQDKQPNPLAPGDVMLYLQLFAAASNVWLLFLVSRKHSRFSFYLLIISFAAGAVFDAQNLLSGAVRGLQWILTIAQYGMQTAGLYYLVTDKSAASGRNGESARFNAKMLDCALGLVESGKYAAAVTLLNGILESDPGNLDARCGRGICFMRLGEKEKGLADINFAAVNGNIPALEFLKGV